MLAVLRNAIVGLGVRRIAAGALVLIVSFAAALWALDVLFPRAASRPPKLAATAPLKAATRMSTVTAPIAVALTAIRDTMERQAPRDLAGTCVSRFSACPHAAVCPYGGQPPE